MGNTTEHNLDQEANPLQHGFWGEKSPLERLPWLLISLLLGTILLSWGAAVGLFGIVVQSSVGSLVDWTGRAAQFLSGPHMLVAVLASRRESSVSEIAPGKALGKARYRYAVAVAIVIAATVVRLAFFPLLGTRVAFLTFYPAVILAALYGGLRPGLVAAGLSVMVANFFWMEPVGRFSVREPANWIGVLVFFLSCLMMSVIIEAMHTARTRLALHQDHLEELVKDRTAELEREVAERRRLASELADRVGELQQKEEALRKARDELEQHVQERTAELQQAYYQIKKETREREQAEVQLRQAQKMEALGTLSGGIAHDFNNILAAMIGFAELARDSVPEASREAEHLQRVFEAGLRGRELIRQMLTFSRKTEQEKKPVRLSSIVKETVKFLRASTPSTISIRVNVRSESGLILGDPAQIQQVVMNLCSNAVHAMQAKGGVLDVEVSDFSVAPSTGDAQDMEPVPFLKLVVRDTGIGIPPDVMHRIFDPFFTTKKPGEGTGLGLSVVHGIVNQSGGSITVESEPGKGSTFIVCFPKIAEGSLTAEVSSEALPTGEERILFVDDEEPLVVMGEELLRKLGYEVLSRTSSKEALALVRENPSRFDLVITDQTMPDITGLDLAREILALRPDMPVILCTGFSHIVDEETARSAGIKAFVMKPLTKKEIAGTIRRVLGKRVQ